MTTNLHTFVDLYTRQLGTLTHLLNKGAAFAKEKGVSEKEMLGWRLIDDMQPLSFQISVVVNFTRAWPARVAGLPPPADIDANQTLATYLKAIEEAKSYLAEIKPEQFKDKDNEPLKVTIGNGMEPTFPKAQWLTVFATTNIYFHLSIAYAILRSRGVQIGKIDLFGSGL